MTDRLTTGWIVQKMTTLSFRQHRVPSRLRHIRRAPRDQLAAFHAWYHAIQMHGRGGQNFGISLVVWDRLFGTAHWANEIEASTRYGIEGMCRCPTDIWHRLWEPFRCGPRGTNSTAPRAATPEKEKAAVAKRQGG